MGNLFKPICMVSSTEGASPPELMNWMHADSQIGVEKRLLIDDLKTPIKHAQGSIFFVQKTIVLPVTSEVPSTAHTLNMRSMY